MSAAKPAPPLPHRTSLSINTRTSKTSLLSNEYSPSTSPAVSRRGSMRVNADGNAMRTLSSQHRGSATSLTSPASYVSPDYSAQPPFTTPFATYEEPTWDLYRRDSTSSLAKTKRSRLRKMSRNPENHGQLDLSRSSAEYDRPVGLGLGVPDLQGPRAIADVSFSHTLRAKHNRTTSIGSHSSGGSGTNRPGQPFTHPLKQVPRSFTSPTGLLNAPSPNPDEDDETIDVVEHPARPHYSFTNRRSVSISSVPQVIPTPLSQSFTADDLVLSPQMTGISHSNASIRSGHSGTGRSSKLKKLRPSQEHSRSNENAGSPSTRTSFDRAVSFVSRRSESDLLTEEELVQIARRKFEEKEAMKERKYERQREAQDIRVAKRDSWQRRISDIADIRSTKSQPALKHASESTDSSEKRWQDAPETDTLHTKSYERTDSSETPVFTEKATDGQDASRRGRRSLKSTKSAKSVGLSWWFHTRVLSCGSQH